MNAINSREGYCLRLADGRRWCLVATDGTGIIVDKMARMMGLGSCSDGSDIKMIFIRGDYDSEITPRLDTAGHPELGAYPADGWSAVKIGYIVFWEHEGVPDIVCQIVDRHLKNSVQFIDLNGMDAIDTWRVIYSFFAVINKVVTDGGMVAHCAMFERDGRGALIVARSGTGKSTCFRRIGPPWRAISDEQALIVRAGDRYLMHPTPTWSDFLERGLDYSRSIEQAFPLSAFFFLEQAPKDEAVPIGKGKAATEIFNSSVQMCRKYIVNMDGAYRIAFMNRLMDNAVAISRSVPSFTLRATLTGRFWDEMSNVLT